MPRAPRVLPGFGLGLSSTLGVMTALLAIPLLAGILIAKVRDQVNDVYVLSALDESGLMQANSMGRKLQSTLLYLVPYTLSIAVFPFFCELVDRDSLGEGGPRVKLDRIAAQKVRVVSIGEHDQAACAGVHLHDASEIGMLLVTKFTSARPAGDWEIEFMVGPEAVQAAVDMSVRSLMLAERMGALPQDSLTAFDNRETELIRSREALKTYGRMALSSLEPVRIGGMKLYSGAFPGLDRKLLMERATELASQGGTVVALAAEDEKAFLVLACSGDAGIDCPSLLNRALAQHGGKGGGKTCFASGGTPGQVKAEVLLQDMLLMLESCIKH